MGETLIYIVIGIAVFIVFGIVKRMLGFGGSRGLQRPSRSRGGRGNPSELGTGGAGAPRTGWQDLRTGGDDGIEIDNRSGTGGSSGGTSGGRSSGSGGASAPGTGWRDLDAGGGDGIEIDERSGTAGGGDTGDGWRETPSGGGDGIRIEDDAGRGGGSNDFDQQGVDDYSTDDQGYDERGYDDDSRRKDG